LHYHTGPKDEELLAKQEVFETAVSGVPIEDVWSALIKPSARQQVAPSEHGISECIQDKWMPIVHPGI